MKILITGANGFLGKELSRYFKDSDLTLLSRHHPPYVDLLNNNLLESFFTNNKKFDYVFHTAICGGKRGIKNDLNVLINNLNMYKNLLNYQDNFNYMFNFCSGAALQNKSNVCDGTKEEFIYENIPSDYYGLSKNLIAREISQNKKIINFRLFGCFGNEEDNTRFFKSILNNIKTNNVPIIYQDKYMDFISAIDVAKILEYYILSENIDLLPKDINLVYQKKMKLSQMYEFIKSFTNTNLSCKILNNDIGSAYTGDGSKLAKLNINLLGLEKSLMELTKHVIG